MNFQPESTHDFTAFSEDYQKYLELTQAPPEPEPVNPDGNCPDCKPDMLCRKHFAKAMAEKYG